MVNFETDRNLRHPSYEPEFCEIVLDEYNVFYYFDGLTWVAIEPVPEDAGRMYKRPRSKQKPVKPN